MLSSAKLFILSILAIILLEGPTPGYAGIRRYKFELKNTPITRFCTNKTILTINGQFPGPTMFARRGDLIIVDIINSADHIITLHWHGVKLPRYPWADGPNQITQCPISPGNRFTQRIILSDEEGTLWWHAHSEWSRNTVHGALVILPAENKTYPFPKPAAEFPILLGEWWNENMEKVYEDMMRSGANAIDSDGFHINGLPGHFFPCSYTDIHKVKVEFGKTYLFRLINTGMNNIMYFGITDHNMTVVGSEGYYTKPFTTSYIAIAPGQTVDFLLKANQPPSRYYMAAIPKTGGKSPNITKIPSDKTPATAHVQYVGNYDPPKIMAIPPLPKVIDVMAAYDFATQLRSLKPVHVPKEVTVNLFYVLAINLRPCSERETECAGPLGQRLLASVNNMTLVLPKVPFLEAYFYGMNGVYTTNFPDRPPFPYNYTSRDLPKYDFAVSREESAVRVLEYGSTVEIVLQGTYLPIGMDHPIHLHGYSFYVVGSGFGTFDPDTDPANYNLIDPPLMDTIVVPTSGWTAIRFTANNPGVWYLHCHFDRHRSIGMGVVFIVKDGKRKNEKMLPPPPDMPPCEDPPFLPGLSSLDSMEKNVVS